MLIIDLFYRCMRDEHSSPESELESEDEESDMVPKQRKLHKKSTLYKRSSKYVKSILSNRMLLSTCNMQEFAKILIIFIFTDIPDQIVLTAVLRKRLKIKL